MDYDWGKGGVILVDGHEVARVHQSWVRERAEVQIGPQLWRFRSAGWASGTLVAELDGTAHHSARRSGIFTSTWVFDTQQLELRQAGWFSSRLTLSRGGTPVGEAARSGIFTTRPRLTLTEDLDVRMGCFVLWVAHVELNRRASDGSS